MIKEYIERAIKSAKYEILSDGTFYGEIPVCPGVYANCSTLEDCRNELLDVLEEWLLLRIKKNLEIPELDGFGIKIMEPA